MNETEQILRNKSSHITLDTDIIKKIVFEKRNDLLKIIEDDPDRFCDRLTLFNAYIETNEQIDPPMISENGALEAVQILLGQWGELQ